MGKRLNTDLRTEEWVKAYDFVSDFVGRVSDIKGQQICEIVEYATNEVLNFEACLGISGIDHFTAKELTTPNHKKRAKELGYESFLPKKEWWIRGVVLAMYADYLRKLVGESIRCRNWWRPTDYNTQVASSLPDSDHPHACAFDLDFKSVESKKKAAKVIKELYKKEPWLELSVGFYSNSPRTIHIGFLSPKGRRRWGH